MVVGGAQAELNSLLNLIFNRFDPTPRRSVFFNKSHRERNQTDVQIRIEFDHKYKKITLKPGKK